MHLFRITRRASVALLIASPLGCASSDSNAPADIVVVNGGASGASSEAGSGGAGPGTGGAGAGTGGAAQGLGGAGGANAGKGGSSAGVGGAMGKAGASAGGGAGQASAGGKPGAGGAAGKGGASGSGIAGSGVAGGALGTGGMGGTGAAAGDAGAAGSGAGAGGPGSMLCATPDDGSYNHKCNSSSANPLPSPSGYYYTSDFGCYTRPDGTLYKDPSDNCIPACDASSVCPGLSGPDCEAQVQWYAADASRFGCLSKIRVTNCDNGRSAILMALDVGPNCTSVEQANNHAVLDMSVPAMKYLFDGQEYGSADHKAVVVEPADASATLGPITGSGQGGGGGQGGSGQAGSGQGGSAMMSSCPNLDFPSGLSLATAPDDALTAEYQALNISSCTLPLCFLDTTNLKDASGAAVSVHALVSANFELYELIRTEIDPNGTGNVDAASAYSTSVLVSPDLVAHLQTLRVDFGGPVNLTSGFRSPKHQRAICQQVCGADQCTDGSGAVTCARNSRHMWGAAADMGLEYESAANQASFAFVFHEGGGTGPHLHVDMQSCN